jgi:putative phosphoesterase
VHAAFAGVQIILHAGDVGGDEILDELSIIAPAHAVFGNTDAPGNPRLRETIEMVVQDLRVHVSHGHELGAPKPERLLSRYAADVIVFGHTHQPLIVSADGRLVVNPGAAGPARFDLTPSVAILEIEGIRANARIVPLD